MNVYEAVGNAVVEQAAEDYKRALCAQKKIENQIKELRSFFEGDDIRLYTSLDGPTLMRRIEQNVKACNYQNIEPMVADKNEREKRKKLSKLRKSLLSSISIIEELRENSKSS